MAAFPALDEKLTSLLKRTFPSADTSSTDPAKLSTALFAGQDGKVQYTDAEKGEINQWVITAAHIGMLCLDFKAAVHSHEIDHS